MSDRLTNVIFSVLGVLICAGFYVACIEPMYMDLMYGAHTLNDWNDKCERRGMQEIIAPSGNDNYCIYVRK